MLIRCLNREEIMDINAILEASKSERSAMIQSMIREHLSSVLGQENESNDLSFFDMGMESASAVEFSNELQSALGDKCQINPTIAFNYPTISLLASYIEQSVFPDEETITEKSKERTTSSIEQMNAQDKEQLLEKLINEELQ